MVIVAFRSDPISSLTKRRLSDGLFVKNKLAKMSMSGIEVHADVQTLFNDIKIRHMHKYATFKIEDKKRVVIDKKGDACRTEKTEDDKEQFAKLKALMTKEPRYILYDFGFTNSESRKIEKLAFLFWCPEDCKIGDKMIYASTKDTVKKTFTGLALEFQANEEADFDYDEFQKDVARKA